MEYLDSNYPTPDTNHQPSSHGVISRAGEFRESQNTPNNNADYSESRQHNTSFVTLERISWRTNVKNLDTMSDWPLERVLMDVELLSLETRGVTWA